MTTPATTTARKPGTGCTAKRKRTRAGFGD